MSEFATNLGKIGKESESRFNAHEVYWSGYGLEGQELEDFTIRLSGEITKAWQLEHQQSGLIDIGAYRRVASAVGFVGANVLLQSFRWAKSNDSAKKETGQLVLVHNATHSILSGIDRVKKQFPGIWFNETDLVEEQQVRFLELINRSDENVIPNTFSQRINTETRYKGLIRVKQLQVDLSPDKTAKTSVENSLVDDPCEDVEKKDLREITEKAVANLPERLSKVIRMNYGLNPDNREWTYEEIGEEFEVSAGRISQLKAKALRELRYPTRCKKLQAYRASLLCCSN